MTFLIRLALVIGVVSALSAQAPPAPSALSGAFRFERPVQPGRPGPNRLAPDVPLLVGAAPFPQSMLIRIDRRE
jgi:hypothetical protein